MRKLFVMLAALTAGTVSAQTAEPVRSLSGGAVAAQVTTGVLGTAVGFVGGGLVTRWAAHRLGQDEETRGRVALVGAYSSAVLLTAVGPTLVGSRGTDRGSFTAAVGGSAAGLGAAALLRKIGRKGAFGRSGPVALVAGAVIIALPSVGATIAFNSTR